MTKGQFLNALHKTRNNSWLITTDGHIRCYHDGREYCPLTEVARATSKGDFHTFEPVPASEALGLSLLDAGRIAGAADNDPNYPETRMIIKRTLELT